MAKYWCKKALKNGNTLAKDYTQAFNWYKKAAEQENEYAQNDLGVCYYNGEGVAKNHSLAKYWFTKAANQGLEEAQNNLTKLHFDSY